MGRPPFVTLILLSASLCARAQTKPANHPAPPETFISGQNLAAVHQHAANNLIDGAAHPEQIPDTTAYRLVLIALSKPPIPTTAEYEHQRAQLRPLGLGDSEQRKLIAILAAFKVKYKDLIQTYNAAASAANANGQRYDDSLFKIQRDQLVTDTRQALLITLSAESSSVFDAFVRNEKRHMKVSR